MFIGCDKLPIKLTEIRGHVEVNLTLWINHETHWAYLSVDRFDSTLVTEVINELTVKLLEEQHILVKNICAIILDNERTLKVCMYFEQDHDEAQRLIASAAAAPVRRRAARSW